MSRADDEVLFKTPELRAIDPAPVCPYCLADPAMISLRGPIVLGNLVGVIIFCGNPDCRKIWTIDIVGKQEQPLVEPSRFMPRR